MFDCRLQIFNMATKGLSFTKAAKELFITQSTVTKHFQEMENHFNAKLFERNGTKINLIEPGNTFLQYTAQLYGVFRNLEFELNTFASKHTGKLSISVRAIHGGTTRFATCFGCLQ